jgi:hypothetical protein
LHVIQIDLAAIFIGQKCARGSLANNIQMARFIALGDQHRIFWEAALNTEFFQLLEIFGWHIGKEAYVL